MQQKRFQLIRPVANIPSAGLMPHSGLRRVERTATSWQLGSTALRGSIVRTDTGLFCARKARRSAPLRDPVLDDARRPYADQAKQQDLKWVTVVGALRCLSEMERRHG
jgi:hypothetical protein